MPRDSMPSLAKIERHWELLGAERLAATFPNNHAFGIGWGEPFCFRCRWLAPVDDYPIVRDRLRRSGVLRDLDETQVVSRVTDATWNGAGGWLERTHLRDHSEGGDESPGNIVPLCIACHRHMPVCLSRQEGVDYVNQDVRAPWALSMVTDGICPGAETPQQKERRYWRAVDMYHEIEMRAAVEATRDGRAVSIPPDSELAWPRGTTPAVA